MCLFHFLLFWQAEESIIPYLLLSSFLLLLWLPFASFLYTEKKKEHTNQPTNHSLFLFPSSSYTFVREENFDFFLFWHSQYLTKGENVLFIRISRRRRRNNNLFCSWPAVMCYLTIIILRIENGRTKIPLMLSIMLIKIKSDGIFSSRCILQIFIIITIFN